MAGRLEVTVSELQSTASGIEQYAADYENAVNNLRAAAEGLAATWEGDSQVAFVTEQERAFGWYLNMADICRQYAATLRQAAQRYGTADTADVIKVSMDELRATIEQYTAQKAQMLLAYLQMANTIRHLDASYDGDASEALKERFDLMYRNIEQTEARVQDAITELARTADIFSEVEAELILAFGSLETGASPFDLGGGSGSGGTGHSTYVPTLPTDDYCPPVPVVDDRSPDTSGDYCGPEGSIEIDIPSSATGGAAGGALPHSPSNTGSSNPNAGDSFVDSPYPEFL